MIEVGEGASPIIYDIDEDNGASGTSNDKVEIIITQQDGSSYTMVAGTDYPTPDADITDLGSNTFEGNNDNSNKDLVITSIPVYVSKIQIVFTNTGAGSISDNHSLAISNFTFCTPLDSDGDGVFDFIDLDSDNDGIPDNIEAQSTAGYIAPSGSYSETGIDLAYGLGVTPEDTDSDLTPDYLDLNSDDQGDFDIIASGAGLTDANLDGVADGLPAVFGENGLIDTLEDSDTDQGFTDVNGEYDATFKTVFDDDDDDVDLGGDLDYRDPLFGIDTDGDLVINTTDIDDDNDGIIDTVECPNVSGSNASGVQGTPISVGNSGNAIGSDNVRATLNDIGDELIIDLGEILPQNTIIEIESRVTNSGNYMSVDQSESTAPFNYVNAKSYSWTSANVEENKEYKLTVPARYLRIKLAVDNGGNLGIDNISFQSFQPVCDSDGDGIPDGLDLDSDNDGIPDNIEAQDTFTYIAPTGSVGTNGLYNVYESNSEGGSYTISPINTDGSGNPDYLDTDSDGDGVSDSNEANITLSGTVGANGLDNNYDNGDDYTDTNGSFDNTPFGEFPNNNAADSPDDVDWRDATTINEDNDNDGVPDSVDLDDDNDGILDTEENNCTPSLISGNVTAYVANGTVGTPENITGVPDGSQASLPGGAIITTEFQDLITAGEVISITIQRRNGTAETTIEGSADNVTFGSSYTYNSSVSGVGEDTWETITYTAPAGGVKYIRFTSAGGIWLDALAYSYIGCSANADIDGDGITNDLDSDSDGDGLPDYQDPYNQLASILPSNESDKYNYLVKAASGLRVIFGTTAIAAQTGDTKIVLDDLIDYGDKGKSADVASPDNVTLSHLFDYEVENLATPKDPSESGYTAKVTLPLDMPLGADTAFIKYDAVNGFSSTFSGARHPLGQLRRH